MEQFVIGSVGQSARFYPVVDTPKIVNMHIHQIPINLEVGAAQLDY